MDGNVKAKTGTIARYLLRLVQAVGVLLAAYLILTPLFGDFNFFEGLAWTVIGIAAMIGVIVVEVFARGAERIAS